MTHEILRIIHQFDRHAFAFGTTLRQERQGGYDSRVLSSLPGFLRTAVFQYKRPYQKDQNRHGNTTYWYEINNNTHRDQHRMLQHLCGGMRNIAFYVFPAVIDQLELQQHTPNLLNNTFVVDAMDIPLGLIGRSAHDVELVPSLLSATIHSNESNVKAQTLESLVGSFKTQEVGLPIEPLLAMLKERPKVEIKTTRARFHFMAYGGERDGNSR